MKVERWLKVTHVEDDSNLRIDDTFYHPERDNKKEIDYASVQTNGVVVIHTRKSRLNQDSIRKRSYYE